jgi:hypothetical protein
MAAEQTPENPQALPFDGASDGRGFSPTAALRLIGLPAGTLLTVRLRSPISSASSRAGDQFSAVLDDPLVVADQTLLPGGTPVTGKVLSVSHSDSPQDAGYLRIALTAISIHGKSYPLRTASIFLKASTAESRGLVLAGRRSGSTIPSSWSGRRDVEFSTNRLLTFRLTQSLPVQN